MTTLNIKMPKIKVTFLFGILTYFCLFTLVYSTVYISESRENTDRFDALDGLTALDDALLFRMGRLDSNNKRCNEPRMLLRFANLGKKQILTLKYSNNNTAAIGSNNFCEDSNSKNKRFFVFHDNYKREMRMRLRKRTNDREIPVHDKIRIITFHKEHFLVHYERNGGSVHGDIFSIKDTKNLSKRVRLEGNCNERTAIPGKKGFLYLCYRKSDSSLCWQTWSKNGNDFGLESSGTIPNIYLPQSEHIDGALVQAFETKESGKYSVVIGSHYQDAYYTPQIDLNAYFINGDTPTVPYPIYHSNGSSVVDFKIQVCHNVVGGSGHKCLLSMKTDVESPETNFNAVGFEPASPKTTNAIFTVPKAKKIRVTDDLKKGGYLIGAEDSKGDFDGLIYNEQGGHDRDWGLPKDVEYNGGNAGVTESNSAWGMQKIDSATSWKTLFGTALNDYDPNPTQPTTTTTTT